MRGLANGEEQRRNHLRDDAEEEREGEGGEERQRMAEEQQRPRAQRVARPSSGQQRPALVGGATMRSVGYVGKHRLSAAIARLDQELQSLQDELNELETMEAASTACQEVITSTEGKPDPLLPITSGPENASWERWFQRVRSSRSNKWWAPKGSDFS